MISSASVRPAWSRNTAHFSFIISPSSSLISEIRRPPPCSRRSRPWIIFSSAASCFVEGDGMVIEPARSAAWAPARRPKISVSSSELAPSRLPPWTETQATSPAA
jgi:hypothetical protein